MIEPEFLKPESPHSVSDCVPLLSLDQLNLKQRRMHSVQLEQSFNLEALTLKTEQVLLPDVWSCL